MLLANAPNRFCPPKLDVFAPGCSNLHRSVFKVNRFVQNLTTKRVGTYHQTYNFHPENTCRPPFCPPLPFPPYARSHTSTHQLTDAIRSLKTISGRSENAIAVQATVWSWGLRGRVDKKAHSKLLEVSDGGRRSEGKEEIKTKVRSPHN